MNAVFFKNFCARLSVLPLLFAIFLLSGNSFAEIKTPSNPNSAKACAICHLRWIDTFFISGKGTDLIEYQSQKAVATEEMCFSCHDGSVADSRRKAHTHLHDMKSPVPASISIPEQFPLGENKNLKCASCHTPHALPSDADANETIFMRASLKNSAICLMCHSDKVNLTETKHNLFHSAPEERNLEGRTVAQTGPCSACHLQHAQARTVDAKGPLSSLLCSSCHSEGNVAAAYRLKDQQHPLDIRPVSNPKQTALPLFSASDLPDEPKIMTCSTCHDPHNWRPGSAEGNISKEIKGDRTSSFLRRPSPELCGVCHPDKAIIAKTDHDLTVSAPDSMNITGQKPEQSGVCGVCHSVHNSRYDTVLWAQGFGPGNNIMERMCNSCHSKEGVAGNKTPPVYFHPREKRITNKDKQNAFPLFHPLTGKTVTAGNISCPSCHNAHQWDPQVLSGGKGVNTEGELSNSFLRPQVQFELCVECHKEEAKSKFSQYHNEAARKFKSYEKQFFK